MYYVFAETRFFMPVHPQNPTLNSPVSTELLQEEKETGQAWSAGRQADMTSRHQASYSKVGWRRRRRRKRRRRRVRGPE